MLALFVVFGYVRFAKYPLLLTSIELLLDTDNVPNTCISSLYSFVVVAAECVSTAPFWNVRLLKVNAEFASSVAQLHDTLGAVRNLHFTDEELAAIDRATREAGINLWKGSTDQ